VGCRLFGRGGCAKEWDGGGKKETSDPSQGLLAKRTSYPKDKDSGPQNVWDYKTLNGKLQQNDAGSRGNERTQKSFIGAEKAHLCERKEGPRVRDETSFKRRRLSKGRPKG